MIGQVYITRNANMPMLVTKMRNTIKVTFQTNFIPQAGHIIPVSQNTKDVQLAQQLKHLLQKNDNGCMGNVEVCGDIYFYAKSVPRPEVINNQTENSRKPTQRLNLKLGGGFIWLVRKCCSDNSRDSVAAKIKINNFFAGEENQENANVFAEMSPVVDPKGFLGPTVLELFSHLLEFYLNGLTWDKIFGRPESNQASPEVTLVLSVDLSKIMASNVLVVGPTGTGFRRTICQEQILEKRRQKQENGAVENVTIVHKFGADVTMHETYLAESSPVFAAMLSNTGFLEARTKKIDLRSIELEELICLKNYIETFDIQACLDDLGLAIKMLVISDQYQVIGLKAAITDLLLRRPSREFTVAQALQLFEVATKLPPSSELFSKVFDILESHRAELSSNQDFVNFFKNTPNLAMQMFLTRVDLPTKQFLEAQFENDQVHQLLAESKRLVNTALNSR